MVSFLYSNRNFPIAGNFTCNMAAWLICGNRVLFQNVKGRIEQSHTFREDAFKDVGSHDSVSIHLRRPAYKSLKTSLIKGPNPLPKTFLQEYDLVFPLNFQYPLFLTLIQQLLTSSSSYSRHF
jgi:hypothetical protein